MTPLPQGPSGPVGYWKFDENNGTTAGDSSGSGHTGTLQSGATWNAGQSNSAVSLDGADDYVQMGAQSGLVMSTATSLSAWIYPTGAGSDGIYGGVILNKEGEYLIARFADGTIQWAFANTNPGWAFVNTGYVAPVNQWTHVAVTYDSGTIKTFINGTLTHTYNGPGVIGDYNTSLNDFRVGGRQGMSQNFQGRIDEVRAYTRALSASEVSTLAGPPTSGSVGHWKFDENTGTTAVDSSSSGNTGTLSSGAAWAAGRSNSAVSLDGADDYVQVGAQTSLAMTTATSFTGWIYPTGAGSEPTYGGVIINKEGEYEIARFADGTIQWAFANSNPGWAWINTGYVAPVNQWTHVAVTYDSGTIKTFINGTLTHTYNGSGVIGDYNTSLNDFRVGGRQGMSQNFQGRIDEVRVYNRALSASEVSSLNPGSSVSDFAMARLNPKNRTGTGGEDLLSNNFNWSLPLVGLPGRGLDLGLTLSYNSLVWTRSGNYLTFDTDAGSIAPGFRLGFPTIEGPYWNNQAGANFYLLVTPSGGRVELRQVGSSLIYESADSSQLRLTDNTSADFSLLLQPTDGSKLRFEPAGGGWRCTKITDRNGNFINVTYKTWGEIETITDTLNRVLTFNYDANSNLQSITQTWDGQTHEWATFGWSTTSIGNNFPSLTNLGPNSTTIPVLTQVGLPDGSRYNFEYNNTYGQVSTIRHYAFDPNNPNHERSHTTYVFSADGADCPRVEQRKDSAEYWTGFNEVPTEVVTSFAHDADNGCRLTLPDGTVHKEYYGSSWQSGLTTETRSYATIADANSNVWQKKTTTAWTQDNTSVSYLINPRVTETNVYDSGGNRRRVATDYSVAAYAQYGLPYFVTEYAANGTTEIRRTYTDYNLNQAYLDRRIIGLVAAAHVTDASGYQAKVTYGYDDPARLSSQATTATMHDPDFSSGFTVRGNVTAVARWDVSDINNPTKALITHVNYNAAGSVISTTDPATHTNQVNYADSFSDGNNSRNTFAYPTTVTDADGFNSTIQYNYDFGARTRVEGPPPQNQPNGLIQTFAYDSAARLQQVTTLNNGAYTRYVYGPYWVQRFSTVNTVADEAYSITTFDGVGRAFTTTTNHPGSVGGYKLVNVIFDQMGRPFRQSNPTEVNSSWLPAGDDVYNPATGEGGVRYSVLEFDWQGRTKRKTHPDGAYTEASYAGCGCAGGEVVTLTDEGTLVDIDPGPGVNNVTKVRQQKIYSDALGRQWKTEVLNWDGAGPNGTGGSVYSATVSVYNARDQVTLIRQWAGAENGGGAYQDTTMSFDGYARLQSKHVPEQNAETATVYAYNADDTIQSVTDARGANATYGYNNRHLVTSINYFAPTGITPTPNVSYGYDAAGNRTSMTDGLGSQSYNYNQLSQMTSETRTFSDLAGWPGYSSFTLNYQYNLAGQLTTLGYPSQFGNTVSYTYDTTGRLTEAGLSGVVNTQLISGIQHRAWGAVKHAGYGGGVQLNVSYNEKLLPTRYELNNVIPMGATPTVMGTENQYYDDGRIRYARDLQDGNFDRAYVYDHAARIQQATSGREARGLPPVFPRDNPFHQNYSYDVWNNMARPTVQHWSAYLPPDLPSYTNNRRGDWAYNANGQVTSRDQEQRLHTYDASGQTVHYWEQIYHPGSEETWFNEQNTIQQSYDGNGRRAKRVETRASENHAGTETQSDTTYYVTSTVLGGVDIIEFAPAGGTVENYYVGSQKIASNTGPTALLWRHVNPQTGTWLNTYDGSGGPNVYRNELDPLSSDVGTGDPYVSYSGSYTEMIGLQSLYEERGNPFDPSGGCGTLDGMPISCSEMRQRMASGGVEQEIALTNGAVHRIRPRDLGLGMFSTFRSDSLARVTQSDLVRFSDMKNPLDALLNAFGEFGSLSFDSEEQDRSDLKADRHVFQNKKPAKEPGLEDCIKKYLARFFDATLLDAITWGHGVPWYVPGGDDNEAFTLDDHIFFGTGAFNIMNGISDAEMILVAHEVTHSRQYRQNGSLRQKGKYLLQSAIQGIRGAIVGGRYAGASLGWFSSYYGNKYEQEAFDMGKKVRADLEKNGNPCR